MDILNTLFSLAAAIFAGAAIILARKYHKISMLNAKSENLRKFIDVSWVLLSEYEIIENALVKSKEISASYHVDPKLEAVISDYLKELRALGKAIDVSGLFSEKVHTSISEIYSLLRGVVERPVNLTELAEKIKELQNIYVSGTATK